ncbi:monooxygenase [Sporormia fimetaria CBS 119925]|uniref:Monooxygenase n=1 Tax=Sporormia fimetaria CBS 119925 TaxID=1340428 RepID=A0A6A6V958_9PLEO|nr:monooxygenase [Sporormia fimetaria CBS 119925]
MHFSAIFAASSLLLSAVSALPQPALSDAALSRKCNNPPKRVEWRQLKKKEKKAYIDAVLCLTKKKAISGIAGTVNRFDDFVAVHNAQEPWIHWVGHFILWHRYFVAAYEKALRQECGYKGAQPYWDWSVDVRPDDPESMHVFESAIFDSETGFGGNGVKIDYAPGQNPFNLPIGTGGGCVPDGPFTSDAFMNHYPGPEPQCLRRDFIPSLVNTWETPELVAHVLSQPDYTSFARALEGQKSFKTPNIHGGGHFGVGGVTGIMGDAKNSPGDPIFYLHHANLDHIFWQWQQKDRETRLREVGGPVAPLDYSGQNVTMDFLVNLGPLGPDTMLEELLDTEGGKLCYTY